MLDKRLLALSRDDHRQFKPQTTGGGAPLSRRCQTFDAKETESHVMLNFLKNLFTAPKPVSTSANPHQRVFDVARRIVFQMPNRNSMLYASITAKGPQMERQARFELAAYLLHAINFWCQVGNGADKRSCRGLPGAFFQLIQTKDWFGTLCAQAEIQALLADRDQLYFAAYKDGEAVRVCQILTAVLGYAVNGGQGLTIFHDRTPFDPKEIVVEALTDGVHLGAMLEGIEMSPFLIDISVAITDALNQSYRN